MSGVLASEQHKSPGSSLSTAAENTTEALPVCDLGAASQPAPENRAICNPQTHRGVKHLAKPSLNQTGFLSPANQTLHLRDPSAPRSPGPQQGHSWAPSTAEAPVLHSPYHAGAQQGWGQIHAWHLQHSRLRSTRTECRIFSSTTLP